MLACSIVNKVFLLVQNATAHCAKRTIVNYAQLNHIYGFFFTPILKLQVTISLHTHYTFNGMTPTTESQSKFFSTETFFQERTLGRYVMQRNCIWVLARDQYCKISL